ncbi:MAG TPA: hypothetical protein VMB47_08440 [Candidatus Aquilonibacter sp.]|nr:hypothetical protein [Candidatus Aquilonibacter sp.]
MKVKIDRIISIATLIASLVAIFLVLKKPSPVAQRQTPQQIEERARSFDEKMAQFNDAAKQSPPDASAPTQAPSTATTQGSSNMASGKPEAHLNSDEINAVLAQALGTAGAAGLTADSNIGSDAPPIKDQQISFDGDLVHGQFLTEIAGKDVWITISGHLGQQGGYATFDPTEFKVGDLSVPVSLVNPALQKKLAEQRDRLKLPNNVGGLKVEDGQLVMQGK